jgi:hypothetical protein
MLFLLQAPPNPDIPFNLLIGLRVWIVNNFLHRYNKARVQSRYAFLTCSVFSNNETQTPETQGQGLPAGIDLLKALKYMVIGIGPHYWHLFFSIPFPAICQDTSLEQLKVNQLLTDLASKGLSAEVNLENGLSGYIIFEGWKKLGL